MKLQLALLLVPALLPAAAPGANRRFGSRRTELYQALQDGLLWVQSARQQNNVALP